MSYEELRARQEIQQAEMGRYTPVLDDGIRWERLGLGRLFFTDGKPTFCPAIETVDAQ